MSISLTPEQERLVRSKVESGQYASTDDVLGAALRMLDEEDELLQLSKAEIRRQIEEGWESIERGELLDGPEFFAQMYTEMEAEEKASAE